MKKQTFEEFIEALKENSVYLTEMQLTIFITFIEKYRLKTRYINAVNAYFKDTDEDGFVSELQCAFSSDLVSCFIDWNVSSDDNWSSINELWQEYRGNNE